MGVITTIAVITVVIIVIVSGIVNVVFVGSEQIQVLISDSQQQLFGIIDFFLLG